MQSSLYRRAAQPYLRPEPHAGLALIGRYFKRINFNALVEPHHFAVRPGVANSDILKSYLCLDRKDFEATEDFRPDDIFERSLAVRAAPLIPTLRQRLDAQACRQRGCR